MNFDYYMPTRLLFGRGKLSELHKQNILGKKALIVISNGKTIRANGYLDRVINELKKANKPYCIFDEIEANPLSKTIERGAEFGKENECDFLVALGGGSVMDAAKAISTLMTNGGKVWDYVASGEGKNKPIRKQPLPIIAITTTAGTGSEVDQWGVISNEETGEKIGFGGVDALFPIIAIVDPELMISIPPILTAFQGFDALFHSIECYISNGANDMSDMFAESAIQMIAKYLPRAVADGSDIEAREKVALANTLSGIVMGLSETTSEHALEHALSAYHHNLPHGAGLIMISEAYYKFFVNKKVCKQRFIKLAQLMADATASEATDFINSLVNLQRDCKVNQLKMSKYGIERDELPKLVSLAFKMDPYAFTCDPYKMNDEEALAILEESYE